MRLASFLILGSFLALAAGCNDAGRTMSPEDAAVKDRARQERREAFDATADELRVERDQIARQMEDGLKELDAKMDTLGQQIAQATGDAKVRLQQEWDELEPQRKAAQERLDEMKKSSSAAWKDLKQGAQSALTDLKASINRASTRFQDEDSK
jgi:hypothetical protein